MTRLRAAARRLRVPLLLLVLIAAPAVLGAVVGRAAAMPPSPPAAVARLPVIATASLGLLDRPQAPIDLRAAPNADGLVRGSIRRIGVVPSVGAAVQLARNTGGQVCLLASLRAGKQFTATCSSPAAAERDGLTLQFSITAWAAVQLFSERGVLPRFVTLAWTPDGHLHLDQHTDASA
jgi:hypothetical protein